MASRLNQRPRTTRSTRNFTIEVANIHKGMSIFADGIVVKVAEVFKIYADEGHIWTLTRVEVMSEAGNGYTFGPDDRVEIVR